VLYRRHHLKSDVRQAGNLDQVTRLLAHELRRARREDACGGDSMSETMIEDVSGRVANLEAWVEIVMRTLATLGLEDLLTELDNARQPEDKSQTMRRLHLARKGPRTP
jgi:hypothetical protein